jgi:HlyD family secretion protein
MDEGEGMSMKIKFRTVFWSAATLVVVVMLAFAFRPRPVAVDVTQTERGAMTVAIRDEGRTRVRQEYVVSAPVAGRLLRVANKPGDYVHGGDTIARILPPDPVFLDARTRAELQSLIRSAEAALAGARTDAQRTEAQADFARTEAERLESLRERGLISQEALDRARLQVRVADANLGTSRDAVRIREADLEAARARLLDSGSVESEGALVEVRTPVSGRVLRVAQESEGVIAAGAEIMAVGDPRDLEVVAELLSTDAVEVQPGAAVFIEDWGRERHPLDARVRLVEPNGFLKISALGVEEQRVNVIADFVGPEENWAALGHGYRVEVAIVTWQADDVIQAPVSALFRDDGQWAVFRVESGRAVLTRIEVGRDNGRNAEISSGLDAGQTIVLYPGEQVQDGVRVMPRGP